MQNVVIPELEPLEEAVASFGKWRSRARGLLAARPTLSQLKEAVEEAAALRVRPRAISGQTALTAKAVPPKHAARSSRKHVAIDLVTEHPCFAVENQQTGRLLCGPPTQWLDCRCH